MAPCHQPRPGNDPWYIRVPGYLGLRSLSVLRSDFQQELEQVPSRRADPEAHLNDLDDRQSRSGAEVDKLQTANEAQEQRLRWLEIKQKAAALLERKDYQLALEYVNLGLQTVADDQKRY